MDTQQCVPPRFSRRVEGLRPSCVRDMMRRMEATDLVSFAGGLPCPELLPAAALRDAAMTVLQDPTASALQYASTEGYQPLRAHIAEDLRQTHGLDATPEHILITNGSQQALDLIGKVFIDPGDTVVMERPAYMAAIQAFDLYGPRYVGATMTDEGIDVDTVECALHLGPVRLVYTVPTFQNPTGRTYSAETRERLASLLDNRPVVLVEDNPYGQLRYDGEDLPLITTLRPRNTVLVGSFSKILAPGIRMGWLYADPSIVRRMVVAKQASDLCSNFLTQHILYEYLRKTDEGAHLATLRQCYRQRRDTMLALLEAQMPAEVSWTRPAGGMFLWVTLPPDVSAGELLVRTAERGVVFAPGESFYADKPEAGTMRLNFTHAEPTEMARGIGILAEEIGEMMQARPRAR